MKKTKRIAKTSSPLHQVKTSPKVRRNTLLQRSKIGAFARQCMSEKYKNDRYRVSVDAIPKIEEITQKFIKEIV